MKQKFNIGDLVYEGCAYKPQKIIEVKLKEDGFYYGMDIRPYEDYLIHEDDLSYDKLSIVFPVVPSESVSCVIFGDEFDILVRNKTEYVLEIEELKYKVKEIEK